MRKDNAHRHVFLSYASEDRRKAAEIGRAIEERGFSVWWDVDIPTGVHYPKSIETALKSAGCVVVMWSKSSVGSRWVRNEANWGAERGILVPIRIDDSELPWEFSDLQTLDLSNWEGERGDATFERLVETLSNRVPSTGRPPEKSAITGVMPVRRRAAAGRNRRVHLRRVALGAAAVVVIAVAVGLGLRLRGGRGASAPRAGLRQTPLTGDGITRSSAISPDGRYLAYAPMEGDRSGLFIKQIDSGNARALVPMGRHGVRSPVFSPDGTEVYYAFAASEFNMSEYSEYDLYRISMLGGTPQEIVGGIVGRRFAVSPDGRRVAYKTVEEDSVLLVIAEANGAGARCVMSEARTAAVKHCCVAWSCDGEELLTTVRDPEGGLIEIVSVPLDGRQRHPVMREPWQAVLDLHTLADGAGLLIVGCPESEGDAFSLDLWYAVGTEGALTRVTSDMTSYYQVSSSASGDRLALTYYAQARRVLRVIDAVDGTFRDVSTDMVPNGRVSWATDDVLVANQRVGNHLGLVVISPSDGSLRPLATEVDYVSELDVSPDGETVAFTSFTSEGSSLWLTRLDGGTPRRIAPDGASEMCASFSPDGSWVAAMHRATAESPWLLRRRELSTGETRVLSEAGSRWPLVSPDGTWIAARFLESGSGRYLPGLLPSSGGEHRVLDQLMPYDVLGWSPDGAALTCCRKHEGTYVIENVTLNSGDVTLVAELPAWTRDVTGADWNVRGDKLAVCLQSTSFDVVLLEGLQVRNR